MLHGVAEGFVGKLQKSFIRNNRVKKMSSEPDAVIKRATSDSRAIGSRPLLWNMRRVCVFFSIDLVYCGTGLKHQLPWRLTSHKILPYLMPYLNHSVAGKGVVYNYVRFSTWVNFTFTVH